MKIQNWRQVQATKPAAGVTMRILAGPAEKAPTFVMRHFEFEPGAAMPFHAHPWEHEFFVLEGKGKLRISGGKELPLEIGDAAVVLPNEQHSVMNPNKEILRIICLVPLVDGKMPTAPAVDK
jgi:quercetin dioxygenase-like cupin family protein